MAQHTGEFNMVARSPQALLSNNLVGSDFIAHPIESFHDFKTFIAQRYSTDPYQYKPLINRIDFLKQITLYLPEVTTHIDEHEFGKVHLEVGAVLVATQRAIAERDLATVRKHLILISDLFDRANAELYEAVRVFYLEALFLGQTSAAHMEARSLLPRTMEHVLRQAELDSERCRS